MFAFYNLQRLLVRLALPLAALPLLLLAGCKCLDCAKSPEEKPNAELVNTLWRFTVVAGEPVKLEPDQREPSFVLELEENRTHGFAGCNRFSGSYTLAESSLSFSPLMATKMACPGLELEQRVFDALGKTTGFRIAGDTLTLLEGETELATCEALYLK